MAPTTDKLATNRDALSEVDVTQLVKGRLADSLPRMLWVPLFYGVYVPLSFVGGVSWRLLWMGMPWTGFGGVIAVVYLAFGVQAAYMALGLLIALVVVAAGVYGNLEPAQVRQLRDYGARSRRHAKWCLLNSLF